MSAPVDRGERDIDPGDEIELAALIETLRAATPPRDVLAPVRAKVVRTEATRATRRMPRASVWQAAAVIAIAFALGVLARDSMSGAPMLEAVRETVRETAPAPARVAPPQEPALALVPAPPVEVIDDATTPSPVARFVETAGSFPSIEDGAHAEDDGIGDRCEPPPDRAPPDGVLHCGDPLAP